MKVTVISKPNTDYSRTVEEYLHDFEKQTGHTLSVLDPDTADGASFCRAYDIVEYPTVIATDDDSRIQNLWRGLPLPTISEVSFYAA